MVLNEPFELADRDEPLAPRCLHRLDGRHDSTVDRRDADAERLRSLLTGVRQRARFFDLPELARRRRGDSMSVALSLTAALSTRAHLLTIH